MMFCALKKMTWKSLIKIYDVLCIKKNDMEIPYQNLWCFVHWKKWHGNPLSKSMMFCAFKKITWKSLIKIYDVLCIEKNDMEIPYQNLWCFVHWKKWHGNPLSKSMMFCALKKMTWKSPIKIYDVLCIKKNDMEIPYQNLWCFVH